MSLPNFTKYFCAAQLAQLPRYHATTKIPLWVAVESVECNPLTVSNLLWFRPADHRNILNPITRQSLSLWAHLKSSHTLQSPHNSMLSFLHNPAFYSAWSSPSFFQGWSSANLICAYKLMTHTGIKSFPSLSEMHNLPALETFHYLQIKHFLTLLLPRDSSAPSMSFFEQTCKKDPYRRKLISTLYSHLLHSGTSTALSYVMKWEGDLERSLDLSDWNHIWEATKSSSRNIVALETNYKVLTRWYLVTARITKFVPHYSSDCFRDCPTQGTFLHI